MSSRTDDTAVIAALDAFYGIEGRDPYSSREFAKWLTAWIAEEKAPAGEGELEAVLDVLHAVGE
jgi:hypothetical protein